MQVINDNIQFLKYRFRKSFNLNVSEKTKLICILVEFLQANMYVPLKSGDFRWSRALVECPFD